MYKIGSAFSELSKLSIALKSNIPKIEIPDFYQSLSISKLPDVLDSYDDSLDDEQKDGNSNNDDKESNENSNSDDKESNGNQIVMITRQNKTLTLYTYSIYGTVLAPLTTVTLLKDTNKAFGEIPKALILLNKL